MSVCRDPFICWRRSLEAKQSKQRYTNTAKEQNKRILLHSGFSGGQRDRRLHFVSKIVVWPISSVKNDRHRLGGKSFCYNG